MSKSSDVKCHYARVQIFKLKHEIIRIKKVIADWEQTILDHGGDLE
tara:strand:+ start:2506 stop:2643 length:138 start_codon:yes stop_codon:yes gene_type:complete